MDSKIKAIEHLARAFTHNAKFKKAWVDYIELVVIEAIEERKPSIANKVQLDIAKAVATKVLGLFDPDWWEPQMDSFNKPGNNDQTTK